MLMERSFHAHILLINQSSGIIPSMIIRGMKDKEMAHLQIREDQDKGRIQRSLHLNKLMKCMHVLCVFFFHFNALVWSLNLILFKENHK